MRKRLRVPLLYSGRSKAGSTAELTIKAEPGPLVTPNQRTGTRKPFDNNDLSPRTLRPDEPNKLRRLCASDVELNRDSARRDMPLVASR